MKKIYFAGRIPKISNPEDVLNFTEKDSVSDIVIKYKNKKITKDGYIKNGPWILNPIDNKRKMPLELSQPLIWNMVCSKIIESDIFTGIINDKSYGTIVEAGYAAALGKPVYLFTDNNLQKETENDLWFVMQVSRSTLKFWEEKDFSLISGFKERNISNISEYLEYINSFTPKFLQ